MIAGRTRQFYSNWRDLTNNKFILSLVRGVKLEFMSEPVQVKIPVDIPMSNEEKSLVDLEIQKMIQKGAVE